VTAVEALASHQTFADSVANVLPNAERLAFAMLQNPHDCEDAIQDATFKAWRAFPRLRQGSDFRAWFLTIVANECRQRRRNRWWSVVKSSEVDTDLVAGEVLDDATLDLRRALARLPREAKLVLVLRYYLDLSFEDMARVLNVSAAAAKSRTHRALSRLRVEVPEILDNE
jgi:RNA polymerase sigma-70 factor (ECF subfamily)